MIFVTVGTQDKPFTRLINKVEDLVKQGNIKDDVIVQSGNTKYNSDFIKILNYIPFNEFEDYIKKADIIITHGGVGSILNGIKQHKKIIAVPRLSMYNEHINDHQLQVIKKMTEDGYILSCDNLDELLKVIDSAKNFKPKKYTSNTENFIKGFSNVLEELLNN